MNFKKALKNKVLLFDGAMGTMLQRKGLKVGELPELWNIEKREEVIKIHRDYIDAGADIITTNTFGANELKLCNSLYSVEEIIRAAVENAKIARAKEKDVFVALDIGPIGELIEPLGTLSFDEAYNIFKRQIKSVGEDEIDLIIFETFTDLYELKAAILAAKENTSLPILASMTFEENLRTFTGVTPISMILTLESLGVEGLGINCSLGPKEMDDLLEIFLENTGIPILVQPNAGLPKDLGGRTIFPMKAREFACYAEKHLRRGVSIYGGCCGTDYNHIKNINIVRKKIKLRDRKFKRISGVCTATNYVLFDRPLLIGERINPTGNEIIREAIINSDMDTIIKEALDQAKEGADILDINVGLPGIDERSMMIKLVKEIQAVLDIPLQIDSNNPQVIEGALRYYNGKAIINSLDGSKESMRKIFPLVKKYGASIIGLCLDERGVANKAKDRLEIAKKIVKEGKKYTNIDNIIIDPLSLTIGTDRENANISLESLNLIKKELKIKTVLGISNISYGLPDRWEINRTFLNAALYKGLDLAIVNTKDKLLVKDFKLGSFIFNRNESLELIEKSSQNKGEAKVCKRADSLEDLIIQGRKHLVVRKTEELLETMEALEIIEGIIIPSLEIVGKNYEEGRFFLPQLIQSSEAVQGAFKLIKKAIEKDGGNYRQRGDIILATVKGDVHDIGKNIVKVLLENYNYRVFDLGKNVDKEEIWHYSKKYSIKLIGLSALMTTTVKSMEETIAYLKGKDKDIKIMVGGAVLNKSYAREIGADYYGENASKSLEIVNNIFKS